MSTIELLPYTIEAWSSYSGQYHPTNILVIVSHASTHTSQTNAPDDQSHRWSSATNNQQQYILLKLQDLCVVETISFGKYCKAHVCNLKEFRVLGGPSQDTMVEMLHCGLQNNSELETIQLRNRHGGVLVPCRFIKIVPIAAWGANFNFSIWYVALGGINDNDIIEKTRAEYESARESAALRLCLKHIRSRGFASAFTALSKESGVALEHPIIAQLHYTLVNQGNYTEAEKILDEAMNTGLLEHSAHAGQYTPKWQRINIPGPGPRGGHQMVVDSNLGQIILFGGWDGSNDLGDLWIYDMKSGAWQLIIQDTAKVGGPSARSCHKICLDTTTRKIYTIGRYVEGQIEHNADFYSYDIDGNTWTMISKDTEADGGPPLMYDHQFVCDEQGRKLYAFGGRTIRERGSALHTSYCGLYCYAIETGKWTCLLSDPPNGGEPGSDLKIHMRSRMGHSMVLDPSRRALFIFAGQRFKDYLGDFYRYNIDDGTILQLSIDTARDGGPEAGFTQRATVDSTLGEFYVFSGLMRESSSQDMVKNSFWVYHIETDKWNRVYMSEMPNGKTIDDDFEPRPRFAHQLVYDEVSNIHYIFGGNPGNSMLPKTRLNDFWQLHLSRREPESIKRQVLHLIRGQCFKEMCSSGDTMAAIEYMKGPLATTVDMDDPSQCSDFRALTFHLFDPRNTSADAEMKLRNELFEQIVHLLPPHSTEPRECLVDLVPW